MLFYIFCTLFFLKDLSYFSCKDTSPVVWGLVHILNDSYSSIFFIFMIFQGTYLTSLWKYQRCYVFLPWLLCFMLFMSTPAFIYEYAHNAKISNTILINGLLLIHPVLLYFSATLFAYLKISTTVFQKKLQYTWVFSMSSLFLGSWWAQQELNWGGWWNWDPIESIALMLFVLTTATLHISKSNRSFTAFAKPALLFLLVVSSYYLSRYDALKSIHSFTTISSELNNIPKLFFILIVTYSVCTYLFKLKFFFLKNPYINTLNMFMYVMLYTIIVITINISGLSYTNNSFFKKNEFILLIFLPLISNLCFNFRGFLNKSLAILMFISIHVYLLCVFFYKNIHQIKKSHSLHLILIISIIILVDLLPKEVFFIKPKASLKASLGGFFCKLNEFSLFTQYNCNHNLINFNHNSVAFIKPDFFFNRDFFQTISTTYQVIRVNIYTNSNITFLCNAVTFVQVYTLVQSLIVLLLVLYFWLRLPNFFKKVV